MKFGIDWSEASTKRGAIWVVVFIAGLISEFTGVGSIEKIVLLGSGVAGGLGVLIKD